MGYEDIAPIPLVITEAGGRVSDLDGTDVLSGNGTVLASNGHIHDALLDLVRGRAIRPRLPIPDPGPPVTGGPAPVPGAVFSVRR